MRCSPICPRPTEKPFATRYVTILLLAEKAHEMGLDKTPEFDEQMYIARLQLSCPPGWGQDAT